MFAESILICIFYEADGMRLDFFSYQGLKLYKNIQGFYIGNSRLTCMMFFSMQLHGEGFPCSLNILIMTVYHTFKVRNRTINKIDIITAKQFVKLMCFWEMFTQRLKDFLPIFLETCVYAVCMVD